ncbi:hypothetical protein ACXWTF_12785 [Thiomicrolovo sp. ZZH C-3]
MEICDITHRLLLTDLLNDVRAWSFRNGYLIKVDEITPDGRETFSWVASEKADDIADRWLYLYELLSTFLSGRTSVAVELGYMKKASFKPSKGRAVVVYRVTGKAILDLGHLFP